MAAPAVPEGGQIPIRPQAPSPRTTDVPMAFTGPEYGRGMLWTLLIFNVGFPVSMLLWGLLDMLLSDGLSAAVATDYGSMGVSMIAMVMICAPISAGVAVTYGGAAAYGLGRLLQRDGRRWLHRIAFAALGTLTGAMTTWLFGLTANMHWTDFAAMLPAILMTAVSVWAGWEITSRKALRSDAREREAAARL
ncbi:hypothetical protein JOF28_000144 [Leucobacter exalbidus]|uniref:Uncharacterized protein n=1 Tax=Leucobacter exalbidus TaxID=662960 RepID=A0A940PQV5_9MICO|nr:hypothetical protein [Leucobacter exalbidus]MBP1324912.1 hypothetical protein [Leucobacter exalbidus]